MRSDLNTFPPQPWLKWTAQGEWALIHCITWFWAWLWKFYSASGAERDSRLVAHWLCIDFMNANCALSLASRFGGMSGSSSMALKGWSFFKGSLWWILSSLGTCWGRGVVWWHAARARWRRWTNQAGCWKEKAVGHFNTWPRFWWHLLSLPLVWLMLSKALPLLGSSVTVYTVCEPCLAQPCPLDDHLARPSAFEVPPVTYIAVTASQTSLTCLHVPYSCLPSRRFPSVRPRFDPRLQRFPSQWPTPMPQALLDLHCLARHLADATSRLLQEGLFVSSALLA